MTKWIVPHDKFLEEIKQQWYNLPQEHKSIEHNKQALNKWFQSSKLNNIIGWESMGCVDLMIGCTHYIESFILGQNGLDNFQVLPDEYAYYSFLGKWGTQVGDLKKGLPLIITLPNYNWADLRPDWNDVLSECESKKIPIHIDAAWLTLSKDIEIDLSHPAIQSIGMGISKYSLQWNRVGLRYSKQRKMDSITIFNKFYIHDCNDNLYDCARFCVERIPRDYMWNTYGKLNSDMCIANDWKQTNLIHGVWEKNKMKCITKELGLFRGVKHDTNN